MLIILMVFFVGGSLLRIPDLSRIDASEQTGTRNGFCRRSSDRDPDQCRGKISGKNKEVK